MIGSAEVRVVDPHRRTGGEPGPDQPLAEPTDPREPVSQFLAHNQGIPARAEDQNGTDVHRNLAFVRREDSEVVGTDPLERHGHHSGPTGGIGRATRLDP